jgi:hypothetical protein
LIHQANKVKRHKVPRQLQQCFIPSKAFPFFQFILFHIASKDSLEALQEINHKRKRHIFLQNQEK